jgi:4-amino-4-deoxy-L-arabinose transferase-like glycosyltransferase
LRKSAIWAVLAVLLLRLPFLNQAWQLDDYYYLKAGQNALANPLHPNHLTLVFLGNEVDMRGHPHPPGNAWWLGLLLRVFSTPIEMPFHAAYLIFSAMAVWGMWRLARRFAPGCEVEATLLFVCVPAFWTSGNSLMTDVPHLAFWMTAAACFVEAAERRSGRWLAASALAMACAAMMAYQAVMLAVVLGAYLWWKARDWSPAWVALASPLAAVGGFQLFERLSTGALPASQLTGYLQEYGLQRLAMKAKNAAGLTVHLAWMFSPVFVVAAARERVGKWGWVSAGVVGAAGAWWDSHPLFWVSLGLGWLMLLWVASWLRVAEWRYFAFWALAFFGFCLIIFFAGAARYLLPIAAPMAILAARQFRDNARVVHVCAGIGLVFSVLLSVASYQFWDGYREFAWKRLQSGEAQWVNGEWGLRQYAEEVGARPLKRNTAISPGDSVATMDLAERVAWSSPGAQSRVTYEWLIQPPLPLRLMGLGSKSGYETVGWGLRPFDISTQPADRLTIIKVEPKPVTLSWLPMNAPEAEQHILGGVYGLEAGQWRWMAPQAEFLLRSPPAPAPLRAEFSVPAGAEGRTITLELNGRVVATKRMPGPGAGFIASPQAQPAGETVRVRISIDRGFQTPGDSRKLGMILSGVGFRE